MNMLGVDTWGALIGGLGLFLLAVGMITDGLRLAAGQALRDLLGRWTCTPLHGVGSGGLITALVQSSSAVTVATIGFVNARLLTMEQALGVVYGANIGTTMTGWLVAAVGFKIKVELFALPMIGVGMVLRLTGSGTRRAAIGEALAGFGLFFIGIDVLREAFEGLAHSVDLAALASGSSWKLPLFLGVGFFMTLVTQSSSAAIAITLTAATGGVIALDAAAATVIGANVGTTTTAALAAIGATSNARRVATAHVIFNVVTGVVALLLLPLMLWVVDHTGRMLRLESAPAVALALFHTLFNVLGVLLLWPFTARLASFLRRRFTSEAELLQQPRFLDKTTSGMPALALDAIRLELRHIVEIVRQMAVTVLSPQLDRLRLQLLHEAVASLSAKVDEYVARVERARLPNETSAALPIVLRITHQIDEAADAAIAAAPTPLLDEYSGPFRRAALEVLQAWQPETPESKPAPHGNLEGLDQLYTASRDAILAAAGNGQVPASQAHALLEQMRHRHRMIERLIKAARRIEELLPAGVEPSVTEPTAPAQTTGQAQTDATEIAAPRLGS